MPSPYITRDQSPSPEDIHPITEKWASVMPNLDESNLRWLRWRLAYLREYLKAGAVPWQYRNRMRGTIDNIRSQIDVEKAKQ